ncbi:MAG: alpha/beta hydrolase [Candidatus Methylomirabilales bacterium]
MPTPRRIWLEASDGVPLEGRYTPGRGRRGAVCCHPHPLYGGTMDNRVIRRAEVACQDAGLATVAFNFRGAGRSGGRFGAGVEEVQDVRAAIAYLGSAEGLDSAQVVLVGFSFGAYVAARTATQGPPAGDLILIAPPAHLFPLAFLHKYAGPKLVIAGTRDEFCPDPEGFFARLSDPKRLVLLEGDHFLVGAEAKLSQALLDYLGPGTSPGKVG